MSKLLIVTPQVTSQIVHANISVTLEVFEGYLPCAEYSALIRSLVPRRTLVLISLLSTYESVRLGTRLLDMHVASFPGISCIDYTALTV